MSSLSIGCYSGRRFYYFPRQGDTRDKIASDNQIGAGTVTGIVNEFKKDVDALEYESARELSISCKKQGIDLGTLASSSRLKNYTDRFGANQDEIETHIANIANSPEPEKLFDVANQIAHISMSESIPLDVLADHVKRQQDEKQRLEEEIEKAGAILKQKNVDIQTVERYKKLEDELRANRLTIKDTCTLVSVLKEVKKMGFDPYDVVLEISCVKSLRQREIQLKNSCKNLESHLSRCREVLSLCEQVICAGIGFPELMAYHAAVMKKADIEKISYSKAAYALMDGIDTYEKLIDARKQLNDTIMKIQTINLFLARQNDAVNALMKLQFYGITEDQILSLCKTIETNGQQPTNSNTF